MFHVKHPRGLVWKTAPTCNISSPMPPGKSEPLAEARGMETEPACKISYPLLPQRALMGLLSVASVLPHRAWKTAPTCNISSPLLPQRALMGYSRAFHVKQHRRHYSKATWVAQR